MVQYSLDSIVREFCIERGDSNMNRYAKTYQIATGVLRELNMDTSGVPSTVIIPANTTDSVNLPVDCIDVVRIAICDANGNLQSLGMNENICLPRFADACGNTVDINANSGIQSFGVNFNALEGAAGNYRNGECVGRMFGLGGGNNVYGNYRIDFQRGTIVFGNLLTGVSYVVLEYLSNLSTVDGQYQVHPFIIETLKTGMMYGDLRFNTKIGLGEKQMAKQEYSLAERQAKRRFQNHNLQDWLQAFRYANKLAPKF